MTDSHGKITIEILREKIAEIILKKPEKAAALIAHWVNSPQKSKNPSKEKKNEKKRAA